MDVLLPIAIEGGVAAFRAAARRATQLVFREVQLVRIERRVVFEDAPRERVVFFAEAHEAAETHHRVGDLARAFLDHDALDGADLLAVGPAHRRPLDLVAGDEILRLPNGAAPLAARRAGTRSGRPCGR